MKPNWLNVSPAEGSGNGTISNSAAAHTGRVARTGTVTVTGVGVTSPATYKVTQEPKAEFASYDNGSEMAATKSGGTLTITGKTNSKTLNFAWVGSGNGVTIPTTYSANGTSTGNGAIISGDPGASNEFAFSVALRIPSNTATEEVTRTMKVTAYGGQSAQIQIKQAAGDASLSVSPTSITIPQSGSAVSVQVTSNTSWSVS